jgi:RNA polymerase sigma-70 factor, ECF subfamily
LEAGESMIQLVELVDQAARGEETAQRELYRRFKPAVVRLAGAFAFLDRDEVEDVVQETFIRAFQALPRLRDKASFPLWLLSIARNRARSRLEARARETRVHEMAVFGSPNAVPHFPAALQSEREEEVVRQLIDELPDGPEKQTVWLFYVKGNLSAREIAEQLGVGKSAVTMRLERFRGRVKRELLRRVLAVQRDWGNRGSE